MLTDRNGHSHRPAGAPGGGQYAATARRESELDLADASTPAAGPDRGPSPCPVPAVGHEQHYWVADNDGTASRKTMAASSGEYASTVPPRIVGLVIDLPGELAADAEEAAAALARFDSHARGRLGRDSPALGPMSAILLRTESASSSQIENLTVGARQLALAEIGHSTSGHAAQVTANVRTMEAALRLADHLDEQAILAMHRELMQSVPGWADHAGRYREQLVWAGSSGITPLGASHVGPQAELVPEAMADLATYLRREDVPILVQAAVAHAQFETIHPFADGNGRTGRALVQAIIRGKGLSITTTPPVSAGLLIDTTGYFDALDAYRAGDARPIIERFAAASRFAAHSGVRLVDDLATQVEAGAEALHAVKLRPQAAGWRVLPHLVAQPVVNARYLVERFAMSDQTAQRALAQLSEAGVLAERTGLKRSRIWQHAGILGVLDAYAAALRRG
ncbi:Fic family protein [Microlunatus ginsengisoli]|uniref:Fic family protein n=1 Tax=Microlunatus ginsengisoli TaxID=363863 RepID=A0ABP7AIJ4_9ACTN